MSNFKVELKKVVDDSYEIEIGYELEQKLIDDLKAGLVGKISKFVVVTDSNVKELYADKIYKMLEEAGYKADLISFPAGELSKTRATKEYVEDTMLAKGYRRDCCIIAVGGGVVTDLAGFVAGTYGRGIPFINYATTLLAAADASVGGKTAVDTPLATNLIGPATQAVGLPAQLIPLLIVKMFSSSAATGLVLDIFKTCGPDSYAGMLTSILMSCTETIFYTMSVYFLAAKVTKTRYTLPGALLATLAGTVASIFLAGKM